MTYIMPRLHGGISCPFFSSFPGFSACKHLPALLFLPLSLRKSSAENGIRITWVLSHLLLFLLITFTIIRQSWFSFLPAFLPAPSSRIHPQASVRSRLQIQPAKAVTRDELAGRSCVLEIRESFHDITDNRILTTRIGRKQMVPGTRLHN